MGDVVEIRRREVVEVRRFGHVFGLEYRLGPHPKTSDLTAALYVDGAFYATVEVNYHGDGGGGWGDLTLFLDEERDLVTPQMLGMMGATENIMDYKFLIEAQEYLLGLLEDLLVRRLVEVGAQLSPGETPSDSQFQKISPRERASRVLESWHNTGSVEKALPKIVEAEIYDALKGFAAVLGDLLEDTPQDERTGDFVGMVIDHLSELWDEDDTHEEGAEP